MVTYLKAPIPVWVSYGSACLGLGAVLPNIIVHNKAFEISVIIAAMAVGFIILNTCIAATATR